MRRTIKHIVLAEDDCDDIDLFKGAVTETCPDLELSIAFNGAELITLLESVSIPDLIILDLNMPYKNGKECLQEIRTQSKYKSVPVVILSTSGDKSDIDFCLTNGANKYISKPISYDGMLEIVQDICSGKLDLN